MSFDTKFYKIQTKIRALNTRNDVIAICERESRRIGDILKAYLILIKSESESFVLDAPCGYGNMLFLYRKLGIDYEGFDLDINQVNLAKSIGLSARKADIFSVECKNKYSAISSFDFIEHLEKGDALLIIEKFYQMLRPNGYIFLRTPSGDSPFGLRDYAEDPTHKWIGTSNSISSLLYIAGFKNVNIYEDWPIPRYLKIVRKPLALFLRCTTKAYFWLIGFGWPRCLSSSMIVVAQK